MNPDFDEIKRSIDLAEVVQSYDIKLKRTGRNWKELCPFHDDHTPSLIVTPSKGLFHCPACGAAGNVIQFVAKMEKITDREAALMLLSRVPGVVRGSQVEPKPKTARPLLETEFEKNEIPPLPTPGCISNTTFENQSKKKKQPVTVSPERARQLLERALEIYEKTFTEVPEGRSYLEQRGITDAGLWSQHRIGYCNGRLTEILPTEGDIREELKALGILLPNGREHFTGCVVIPVFDVDGNLVTLYGRSIEEGEKRHVYLPDRPTGLWNAGAAKRYSHLIAVESIFDALSLRMAGLDNVVSIQGTNGFGDDDAAVLTDHGVNKLTLVLDADKAGKEAATRIAGATFSFSCLVKNLPEGEDPNSCLTARGPEALRQLLAEPQELKPAPTQAPDTISDGFVVRCGLRRYEIRGLEKTPRKLRATIRIEQAGKLHVDTVDLYSARWRRSLAIDLARTFEESADTIEADITKIIAACEAHDPLETKAPEATETMTPQARAEAEAFGKSPDLIPRILHDYERAGLIGERANKLLCYIAAVSRKMEKPLSVLILSSSGAGKTAQQDTTLLFCPPEDVVQLTSLTGKALFYKEKNSLKHKVLALEEGDGALEAMYAIRNLISTGELVSESTIKDLTTGRLTTMENRVEGPTTVFFTTTDPNTDPETKSRFFVTSVDESREQTRAILSFQRKRQTLEGLQADAELVPIQRRHHNFQRLLKPLMVINPHAEKLRFGDDRLQGRRDQMKYLNLIKAVAFLRQMTKQIKVHPNGQQYIEADKEDIRIANELANEILGHSLDELSRPGRDLLLQLDAMVEKKCEGTDQADRKRTQVQFTRRDIREFTGWNNARVHRYLQELIELEYVIADSGRNGVLHSYRLVYEGQGKNGDKFLLGLTPIEELGDIQ